jgi:glycosyltransferase involved in cell wall biosynthesis
VRIAVVNNFYPPRVGGSSHLSAALAARYADLGHDVLVITTAFADAPSDEARAGCRVVRIPSFGLPKVGLSIDFDMTFASRPKNIRTVFRLLDDFMPDVVHQHGQFFDLTWITGWWARRRRVRCLLSVHTRLESPRRRYDWAFRAIDAALVRPVLAVHRPDFVVMDSLMDDYIRSRYRATSEHLHYFPVGVDTAQFDRPGDGQAVRERHGLGDRPVLLSLGHVIPLRDRIALVDALPHVLRRHPDALVVVVGEVFFPRFLERAEVLGVGHAIKCVGAVAKAEVPDYLAAATLEIHELQWYGLGTASLEAMAAGVPIVACVRPDNFPKVPLRSGDGVVLAESNAAAAVSDAICSLLDDPAWAESVGAAGRRFVRQHFELDVVASAHVEVLDALARSQA